MNLKNFNSENAAFVRASQKPVFKASQAGLVSLSVAALDVMGLKPEDKISLFQDEDNPEEWYIAKDDSKGFTLRVIKGEKWVGFNSAMLSKSILSSIDVSDKSIVCPIGNEPAVVDDVEYWAIITAAAKHNARKKKDNDKETSKPNDSDTYQFSRGKEDMLKV